MSDAIVVIGGDHKPERVQRAVELFQQGYAPVVIISAGTRVAEGQETLAEAEVMRRQAVALGMPAAALLIEAQSQSTFQNAYYTAALSRTHHYARILLVTSVFHSRRAAHIFREVYGPAVTILSEPASPTACSVCWWFQPDQIGVVAYEYYNWVRYGLGIRLPNELAPSGARPARVGLGLAQCGWTRGRDGLGPCRPPVQLRSVDMLESFTRLRPEPISSLTPAKLPADGR
ncbi:MAG: YdcF family protein [Anaerolineales bacterium]|nr:YdcF family protein [Anaerolineales bacterium]